MKTISELRSHWWYRLLKVVFILTLISWWFFSVALSFQLTSSEELSITPRIQCNNGEIIILGYKEEVISGENDAKYKEFCSGGYTYDSGERERVWWRTIASAFLLGLGLTLVLEILRRIFYYVILNSFRPPKE